MNGMLFGILSCKVLRSFLVVPADALCFPIIGNSIQGPSSSFISSPLSAALSLLFELRLGRLACDSDAVDDEMSLVAPPGLVGSKSNLRFTPFVFSFVDVVDFCLFFINCGDRNLNGLFAVLSKLISDFPAPAAGLPNRLLSRLNILLDASFGGEAILVVVCSAMSFGGRSHPSCRCSFELRFEEISTLVFIPSAVFAAAAAVVEVW
jgi:hypothetical protein